MTATPTTCIACKRSSEEIPLIALHYNGVQYWICPQDLPTLIHQPQSLVGILPGAELLTPHDHD